MCSLCNLLQSRIDTDNEIIILVLYRSDTLRERCLCCVCSVHNLQAAVSQFIRHALLHNTVYNLSVLKTFKQENCAILAPLRMESSGEVLLRL